MNATGRKALPVLLERLHREHPNARYELLFDTPLELLVAVILAAQCTDEKVNQVTRSLFKKYPDARSYAEADLAELAQDVRSTGFFNEKAKAIQAACRILVSDHGGQVPRSMDELLKLPRVARKTANVVLTQAYNMASGIIVDSHVARVSQRLGLTEESKPEKIEPDLMKLVPQNEWIWFGPAVVLHGRYTCTNSNPKCGDCPLEDICAKVGVDASESKPTPTKQASPKAKAAPVRGTPDLPESWREVLASEFEKPYFKSLQQFVAAERAAHTIFPPEDDVLSAFRHAPFDRMKVLLLGQDPYHDDGQAHGLCFSVKPGIKPPPSLVNMFKELKTDLGCRIPNHGCLVPWAEQGVLMLNAVLTVRAHEPNSHKDQGWEQFTDAVIRAASDRTDPMVFVLWGAYAQKKEKLIDAGRHTILKAAHPSPLSAKKFFGSKPFSAIDDALRRQGKTPIEWELSDL